MCGGVGSGGGYEKLGKIECALKSVSSLKGSECIEYIFMCLKEEIHNPILSKGW